MWQGGGDSRARHQEKACLHLGDIVVVVILLVCWMLGLPPAESASVALVCSECVVRKPVRSREERWRSYCWAIVTRLLSLWTVFQRAQCMKLTAVHEGVGGLTGSHERAICQHTAAGPCDGMLEVAMIGDGVCVSRNARGQGLVSKECGAQRGALSGWRDGRRASRTDASVVWSSGGGEVR